MKDKDSKKIKNVNNQSNNSTNNKHAQDYFSTNILLPKKTMIHIRKSMKHLVH